MLTLAALVAAAALGSSNAGASGGPGYSVDWYRIGDISGGVSRNNQFKVTGTITQMAAGKATNSEFVLCSGVECVPRAEVNVRVYYFPIMRRTS
jgi:hypothetical protein